MTNKDQNIIFFDGVCILCNTSVQFIIKHEKQSIFFFSTLQSDFANDFLKKKHQFSQLDSIILFADNQFYTQSTAALLIAKTLKFPFSILYIFMIIPKPIRDLIYNYIAKNRYRWFGKKAACMLPSKTQQNRFL